MNSVILYREETKKPETKEEEKKEENNGAYKFTYTHIILIDYTNLWILKFGRKKLYCKPE
jgi:hypothetical protein